jgi:hypothetical protein
MRKYFQIIYLIKDLYHTRSWWLMPVILAPQEAEIRRITV